MEESTDDNLNFKTSPVIIKLCSISLGNVPISEKGGISLKNTNSKASKRLFSDEEKLPSDIKFCTSGQKRPLGQHPEASHQEVKSEKLDSANEKKCKKLKSGSSKTDRQSLTTHLTKLSDNKLENVPGGDESEPVAPDYLSTKLPSVLTDVLEVKLSGSKIQTSRMSSSQSSLLYSSLNSPCSEEAKESFSTEKKLEPTKRKLKLSHSKRDNFASSTVDKSSSPRPNDSKQKLDTLHTKLKSEKATVGKPPLVMQSSNLLSENVLDVGHDRGGNETSKSQLDSPAMPFCSQDIKFLCVNKDSVDAKKVKKIKLDKKTSSDQSGFRHDGNESMAYPSVSSVSSCYQDAEKTAGQFAVDLKKVKKLKGNVLTKKNFDKSLKGDSKNEHSVPLIVGQTIESSRIKTDSEEPNVASKKIHKSKQSDKGISDKSVKTMHSPKVSNMNENLHNVKKKPGLTKLCPVRKLSELHAEEKLHDHSHKTQQVAPSISLDCKQETVSFQEKKESTKIIVEPEKVKEFNLFDKSHTFLKQLSTVSNTFNFNNEKESTEIKVESKNTKEIKLPNISEDSAVACSDSLRATSYIPKAYNKLPESHALNAKDKLDISIDRGQLPILSAPSQGKQSKISRDKDLEIKVESERIREINLPDKSCFGEANSFDSSIVMTSDLFNVDNFHCKDEKSELPASSLVMQFPNLPAKDELNVESKDKIKYFESQPSNISIPSNSLILSESPKENDCSTDVKTESPKPELHTDYVSDVDSDKTPIGDQESSSRSPSNLRNIPEGVQTDDSCSNQMDTQISCEDTLMEFDILDEFESNDNDNDMEDVNSEDESDISADEIDAMLEEGLGDYSKRVLGEDLQHEEKEKVILKVRGRDHFDVLPEGWIEVTHNSGMPIYLHKQSRVCCVSKPYFLGPGSTRKHQIPLSAIPCLHYSKQLEKEKEEAEGITEENTNNQDEICNENGEVSLSVDIASENKDETSETNAELAGAKTGTTTDAETAAGACAKDAAIHNFSKSKSFLDNADSKLAIQANVANLVFPSAKLESVKDVKVSGSLDYLAVREYCEKRFEFQTITVKRFKTWSGRRRHQKLLKRKQRPFLPDSTQLITCPLPSSADKSTAVGSVSKREFIMNPTGKSPVCILHEYVQHTLRVQPKYIFKELESASTPYGAVVIINEMEYGVGYGSSKKVAKSEAARSALEVLIPKIKKFAPEKNSDDEELQDVEFFDQVRVEDPRVSDLSVKAGQPYPYQILLECLKRNYGMGDTEVSIKMRNLKHQKNEFIMKVGKHKSSVVCKNKRDGKHRASQALLQQLHPHITSWGSLLRMYGKGSCKTLKEKKEEEQRITELQSKACVNKPNMSILNKLKEEMLKYRQKMKAKKPIGKLIPERMQFLSVSDSNLKSIEL